MATPGAISKRMGATVAALLPLAAGRGGGVEKPGDINLAHGENNLLKEEMLAICKEALDKNINLETFANPKGFGDQALLDAFSSFFNTYFHPSIPVTPDQIVTTAGSSACLDATIFTICDEGDSILSPAPYWWGYGPFALIHAGATVIPAYTPEISGALTMAIIPALEAAYASAPDPKRIKALITSNPNNPFMQCYPEEVVLGMLNFCQKYGLHYISDEVFANTVFDPKGAPFVSALSLMKGGKEEGAESEKSTIDPSLVHVIWSATKDFGSCGIRSGCIVSQNPLVRAGVFFAAFWQTSALAGIFTTALLTSPKLPEILSSTDKQLAASYQIVIETLTELGIEFIPATAGLWLNAKVKDSETADVLKKAREAGLILGPGTEFNAVPGEKGWIKITFSLPEDVVREGMEKLKAAFGAPSVA